MLVFYLNNELYTIAGYLQKLIFTTTFYCTSYACLLNSKITSHVNVILLITASILQILCYYTKICTGNIQYCTSDTYTSNNQFTNIN